jgi:ferredoxin-NADP reductase
MNEVIAPISARWQSARVSKIIMQTARIKSFFFELNEPMTFVAGQHVDVRLVAPDGYRAMRSYSIASAPSTPKTIELAIERLDDGEVSPFFHEVVAEGDTIDVRGPLGGHFIWSRSDTRPVLLMGGGSGVVPLVSIVRERQAAGTRAPAMLLYSARTVSDVLFSSELLGYDAARNGFDLTMTITREAPARPVDFARRIDTAMVARVIARAGIVPQLAYVCGANAFVDAATDAALAAGVPEDAIRTERYGV